MAKCDPRVGIEPQAAVVRPAMGDYVGHGAHHMGLNAILSQQTSNPAHELVPFQPFAIQSKARHFPNERLVNPNLGVPM